MKYIINYKNNTVYECEVLSEYDTSFGRCFVCLVHDEETDDEVEIESFRVFDNESDANRALCEHIECEMTGANYQAGYDFACGYYD